MTLRDRDGQAFMLKQLQAGTERLLLEIARHDHGWPSPDSKLYAAMQEVRPLLKNEDPQ